MYTLHMKRGRKIYIILGIIKSFMIFSQTYQKIKITIFNRSIGILQGMVITLAQELEIITTRYIGISYRSRSRKYTVNMYMYIYYVMYIVYVTGRKVVKFGMCVRFFPITLLKMFTESVQRKIYVNIYVSYLYSL